MVFVGFYRRILNRLWCSSFAVSSTIILTERDVDIVERILGYLSPICIYGDVDTIVKRFSFELLLTELLPLRRLGYSTLEMSV